MKNLHFQNIQKNFCKNGSAKPLFMRVPRAEGRNGGRPYQGIDTAYRRLIPRRSSLVEMKVAPIRALTHWLNDSNEISFRSRNEGRPYQGIDTSIPFFSFFKPFYSRNEGRPYQGISVNQKRSELSPRKFLIFF